MTNTEILSFAVLRPHGDKEAETLTLLREFYAMMQKKGYSSDLLYRDPNQPGKLLHMRIWRSEERRDEAQNDPDVHHYWRSLTDVCTVLRAYERMEVIFSTVAKPEEG